MAKIRQKVWGAEVLTASDLNTEFDNIINTPMALISPAVADIDMAGWSLTLDVDKDTFIKADTANQMDFTVGGTLMFQITTVIDTLGKRVDLDADNDSSIRASADDTIVIETLGFDGVIIDGTAVTPVNGLQITTAATGNPCAIAPQGEAGAALSIDLNGGPLIVDVNGDAIIEAIDNNDVVDFKIQNFDALRVDGSATTPVNGITIASQATGVDATITGHGEANAGINLVPAGSGTIKIDGGVLAGKCLNAQTTWDPAALVQGGTEQDVQTSITVTGAQVGDFVLVSCSTHDLARASLTGFVSSTNTVTIVMQMLGAALNLGEGTYHIRVLSRE